MSDEDLTSATGEVELRAARVGMVFVLLVCAGFAVIGLCLCLGLGAAMGWQGQIRHRQAVLDAHAERDYPGARILESGYVYQGDPDPELTPTEVVRVGDWAQSHLGSTCDRVMHPAPAGIS